MKIAIIKKVFILVISLVVLTGCVGVVKAPPALDAKAKEFKPDPATSQVYVYRNETLGGAIAMDITVDGKLAGETGPNSYFKFNLPAGEHTIRSQGDQSVLKLVTQLGKLYFVWQEVKMGFFSANSELKLVSEADGKLGVMESVLIDSSVGK